MPKRFPSLLTLLACSLALAGCNRGDGSGGGGSSSTGDIVIGHVASLTGDTATFGTSCEEGIRLALDEVNAKGVLGGRKIKVLTEDDRSLPDEAKTAAEKLITRDKCIALLGEISSSRSIAMVPVAMDNKTPMLSPGSTNPKVTIDRDGHVNEYVFRNCFIDPFQGESMARFAIDDLKLHRFAFLYPVNSDYGVGLRQYVNDYLQKASAEVVANESYSEKTDTDFRAQLTKIKAANPEAIFVTGYYTEAGLIAQQARELGLNVPLIGGDGWDSDQTIKIGGKSINGCFFTNHYSPDEKRPEVAAFVEGYKKKFGGKVPDAMAILGYDAMKIMANSIDRAGGTDGDKIRDALAATKDFPGASGMTTIDEHHNAKKAIVVVEIKDGRFTYRTRIEPK
jgi:branched-chain amino acid transport system substrate-binding protein